MAGTATAFRKRLASFRIFRDSVHAVQRSFESESGSTADALGFHNAGHGFHGKVFAAQNLEHEVCADVSRSNNADFYFFLHFGWNPFSYKVLPQNPAYAGNLITSLPS